MKTYLKTRKKRKRKSTFSFIPQLPITGKKDEIIDKIKKHQVLIIEGETGSGKTTQIPKFAVAAGRGIEGRIACTQPRRIAAISVASRIAEEMGEVFGDLVGYKIRFKENISEDTYIKVMTDGLLLAEAQIDPWLKEYDTIIIDEAHERSLNIDLMLGILRNLIYRRVNLKLIIASATIDTDKFSKFFKNAPIISVSGRLYPVEVKYLSENIDNKDELSVSYTELAVDAVDNICAMNQCGDILIFMPTERDVIEVCNIIKSRQTKTTIILPLFARLRATEQQRVFLDYSGRKIVVATNIAETSITIPGIRYVVDTGLARISTYLPLSRITALPISSISRSSADQRKGRCGRVGKGVCLRLYKESDYLARQLFTEPEILRANLSEVILKMITYNLGDVKTFPFIDRPPDRSFRDGFRLLTEIDAIVNKSSNIKANINRQGKRRRYSLTNNGKIMSKLPLDSRLSRILIEASNEGCLREAIVVVSALSIRDPFERPIGMEQEADAAHATLKDVLSDFITLLNVWNYLHENSSNYASVRRIKKVCKLKFLSFSRIREWIDIHTQVRHILKGEKKFKNQVRSSVQGNLVEAGINKSVFSPLYESLHKAILTGFLSNIAVKKDAFFFTAPKGREVMIFPGSSVFGKNTTDWIVAAEFVKTSRLFARRVAAIDPKWLEVVAGHLCKHSWYDPHWERNSGQVIAYEQISLFGLVIERARRVSYGKIEPAKANDIFIREALVSGDVRIRKPFMDFNERIINSVKDIENKLRRRDILVCEDKLVDFYKSRLSNIFDIRALNYLVKKKGNSYLYMTKSDVHNYYPDKQEVNQFPETITLGDKSFDCSYIFDPGKDRDGVTLNVPASSTDYVEKHRMGWLVPGLFREKIEALIKGLSKKYRKNLVPVSETVNLIINDMSRYNEHIHVALSRFLLKTLNVNIPLSAWPDTDLPDYLKMRIIVQDASGKIIMSGRDGSLLFKSSSESLHLDPPSNIKKRWEFSDIEEWNFGDLPKRIFEDCDGSEFFPRLNFVSSKISIKLFSDFQTATKMHERGVIALVSKYLKDDLKFLKKTIVLPDEVKKKCKYFGGLPLVKARIYNSLVKEFFSINVIKASDFQKHIAALKMQKIFNHGEIRSKQISKVIKSFSKVQDLIIKIERTFLPDSSMYKFSKNISNELCKIIPENFISLYNGKQLDNINRYALGIFVRFERGINNLEREKKCKKLLSPHILSLEKVMKDIDNNTSDAKRNAVEEYFWMIEEYKISVFAQEIKTTTSVSAKRLQSFLEEIKMML